MLWRVFCYPMQFPQFFLGFDFPEIDKIVEDRVQWNLLAKRSLFSNAMVERNETEADHISQLPLEVLASIMSLLTMREAASMSIISSKLRYLWQTSLTLNFDVLNMIGDVYPQGKFSKKDRMVLQQERCQFVRWIHKILKLHQGPFVNAFRIQYFLGEESASDIDQWIEFALDRGVQMLELDFSKINCFLLDYDEPYHFPFELFSQGRGSSLNHFSLNTCMLSLPPYFSSFKSLVSLTLKNVDLTQEHVDSILSNCVVLEWLSMAHGFVPTNLKFVHPFLRLKHLAISFCHDLEEVELCASNLSSFEYKGAMAKFSFSNTPKLARFMIATTWGEQLDGLTYALGRLASDIPQLEVLFIMSPHMKRYMLPKQLPTFKKLKHINLAVTGPAQRSMLGFASLLKASPLLHKLELQLSLYKTAEKQRKIRRKPTRCYHNHLKEVQIHAFHGYGSEIELAIYLLNSSRVLEKMSVNSSERFYFGDGEWFVRNKNKIPRRKVLNLLRQQAPSTCKISVI